MAIQYCFPTSIYKSALQRHGAQTCTEELRAACLQVRQQDEDGQRWCTEHYRGGYTSYETQRNLHRTRTPFVQLEMKVWRHVRRFADQLDMDLSEVSLAMTDCWVNIMGAGAAHPWHAHPGAVLSGTFYVATPDGSSPLQFEDPRLGHLDGTPPQRAICRTPNRRRVSLEPRAGDVVLFESWLRHQVPCHVSDEVRTSISFNYAWV